MRLKILSCMLGALWLAQSAGAQINMTDTAVGTDRAAAESKLKAQALRNYLKTAVSAEDLKKYASDIRREIYADYETFVTVSGAEVSEQGSTVMVTAVVSVDDQAVLAKISGSEKLRGISLMLHAADDGQKQLENREPSVSVKEQPQQKEITKAEPDAPAEPSGLSEQPGNSGDKQPSAPAAAVSEAGGFIELVDSLKFSPDAREQVVAALEAGTDPNSRLLGSDGEPYGDTAFTVLLNAVGSSDPQLVKIFLEHGADLLWKNEAGESRVMKQIFFDRELLGQMIGSIPSLRGVKFSGCTPAGYMLRRMKKTDFDYEIFSKVIDLGNDLNEKECDENKFGRLIMYAIDGDREELNPPEYLKKLLDAGADWSVTDSRGKNAVIKAVEYNSLDHLKLLREKGADLNVATPDGYTVLFKAVSNRKISDELVEYLVKNGADVNAVSEKHDNVTPLITAVRERRPQAVSILLAAGAQPDAVNSKGRTALTFAVGNRDEKENLEMAEALLKAGADPNREDLEHYSAVKYALDGRRLSLIKLLADHGGNIKAALQLKVGRSGKETTIYENIMSSSDKNLGPLREYLKSIMDNGS